MKNQLTDEQMAKRRKANKIILSVFGGFILLIIIIVVSTSGSKTKTVTTTATSSKPMTNTLAAMVTDWNSKYGGVFSLIGDDTALIGDDGGSQNVTKLGTDCAQLQTDVQTGQADPAIPVASVQQHWSTALSDFAQAATDCINGSSTQDASLITKASTELNQANGEVTATTQAIKQL